jgi:hypothetical protein
VTPDAVLDAIRELYFRATPQSIDRDFGQAIELLKQLPDEDTRARAAVFMEGLAEMRGEFRRKPGHG